MQWLVLELMAQAFEIRDRREDAVVSKQQCNQQTFNSFFRSSFALCSSFKSFHESFASEQWAERPNPPSILPRNWHRRTAPKLDASCY